MCFNTAHYFANTLLPRSSFCYRISRTTAEEAENSLTKIICDKELNLHGICIAVIIKSNYRYLYNECAWVKKGLWQPEDFFFVGFFFSSSSGTLRSMTIKRHGHLCPTRVTSSQLAISPATYTSDCHSTSSGRHNLHPRKHQSHVIYGHLTR